MGMRTQLEMGNLDSYRDWGHSYDYVRAMHIIVQQDQPNDYVVSTGITRSVRNMCEYVFSRCNLNYQDHVVQNPKYLRPEELPYLRGDNTKITTDLGWQPTYSFEALMDEMIEHWKGVYAQRTT